MPAASRTAPVSRKGLRSWSNVLTIPRLPIVDLAAQAWRAGLDGHQVPASRAVSPAARRRRNLGPSTFDPEHRHEDTLGPSTARAAACGVGPRIAAGAGRPAGGFRAGQRPGPASLYEMVGAHDVEVNRAGAQRRRSRPAAPGRGDARSRPACPTRAKAAGGQPATVLVEMLENYGSRRRRDGAERHPAAARLGGAGCCRHSPVPGDAGAGRRSPPIRRPTTACPRLGIRLGDGVGDFPRPASWARVGTGIKSAVPPLPSRRRR